MQLVVLLSFTWACVARPVQQLKDNTEATATPMPASVMPLPALQEEVDLLVYGVLQLSQAMHDTSRSTERRLQRVHSSLGTYNLTLGMLGRETQQLWLLGKQLKGSIEALQMEEKSIQRQSADIRKAFDEVLEGHQALERHVRKLELRLNGAWRPAKQRRASYLSRLKTQTEQQNLTLRFLMDIVQHQQQQMAQQRQQLSQLQEQIPNHLETRLR